jgi:predicted nuclease of restriction endonuclease-like RecB superfamily
VRAPIAKLRVAIRVLERRYADAPRSLVDPRRVRAALFIAASRSGDRELALSQAAAELELAPDHVLVALFADLPAERLLTPPAQPLSASELALSTNHAMVASLLRRATSVRIVAEGNTRALVRSAKLRGLICTVDRDGPGRVALQISGPFSLFRQTLVYGRALAGLLPRVARCRDYLLHAECLLDRAAAPAALRVRTGDPILPAGELPAFDSKVEERFARAFERRADDWDVIREPEPVTTPTGLFFPDFLLRHRRDRRRLAYVEIVGFWTADYLAKKLAQLATSSVRPLILCVDERRRCGDDDFPQHASVIRYRGRVPVDAVLRALEDDRPDR